MGWVCCWRRGGRQRDDRQDVYGDVLIEHILTDPFALKLLHDAGLTRRDQKARKSSLSLNIRAENEGQIVNLLPESSRRSGFPPRTTGRVGAIRRC